jgi:hypothetical protein
MTTVTADDIRVLAKCNDPDPVLVLVDGDLRVQPSNMADIAARVVYSKTQLVAEFGEDITDVEAEVLAGGLTAELNGE